MAIIKDVTVKINNGTATLDAPVQFYEKDHDVELRFRLMDYKYKYDKDPQNILNSVDEDVLEAYTTIVNPRGYELEQINGVVKNDIVIFRLDPTYTDELDELGTYKLQIHIKCTHSEFTIPPITFEVLQRLKGIKVVTDGEDEVDNSEILDNSSKFVSDETGKLIIEWKKGDMISSAKLNAMVDVINDAVDEEKIRQENEIEREKKANNKIQELENTRVEYVNKFDDELDSFADQVDTTMSDYETRFNALTVSQQQDAEIIDARDGEQTLRARLDRDIQKPSIIYEDVEGSYINVDTTCGYAQNVEILGNTIQNQNDLADIRSVGDKVEGQELYEIPVVSYGKNLFNIADYDIIETNNTTVNYDVTNNTYTLTYSGAYPNIVFDLTKHLYIFEGKEIISSCKFLNSNSSAKNTIYLEGVDSNGKKIYFNSTNGYKIPKNTLSKLCLKILPNNTSVSLSGVCTIENIQIEEGTVATPYEPYQGQQLTILSPVQLEKVGDVADRIICKDGVWGVEKNIETLILNGGENWRLQSVNEKNIGNFETQVEGISYTNYISSIPKQTTVISETDSTGIYINYEQYLFVRLENITTIAGCIEYLKNQNVIIKYATAQPIFIPLPHDQQIKLRTFASKTNISFGCEIEPTLKASVPKSLGASVSSHTEQIDNLSKELDKVKKLEESVASEVVTESDFTTVAETSNGYFEDVKLEGRTLVNLCGDCIEKNNAGINLTDNIVTFSGTSGAHWIRYDTSLLKPNTTYTLIMLGIDVRSRIGCDLYPDNFPELGFVNSDRPINVYKFTTPYDLSTLTGIRYYVSNGVTASTKLYSPIILEGDHTQNPPEYFEGIKSVGQDVDEISVLSAKGDGNLFNVNDVVSDYSGYYKCDEYIKYENGGQKTYLKQDFEPNTQYSFTFKVSNSKASSILFTCRYTDGTYEKIEIINSESNKVHTSSFTSSEGKSIKEVSSFYSDSGIITLYLDGTCINKGTTPIPYTPYKENKKRILYYNDETQTWEKPILREWDSIEKHSDGKYYYHKRSGEVVLNGSEKWMDRSATYVSDTQTRFSIEHSVKPCSIGAISLICDKYPVVGAIPSVATAYANGINHHIGGSAIYITVPKTTLENFIPSLQSNPVTVVYQLAEEKVYKCTDLDLITYQNETNLMVESGVIVPKTTLKLHQNIANIATILQEKVNLLENNVGHVNGEIDNINTDLTSLTESIEGSSVSVVSKDGYLKDVEIIGNTIQNQNDLADIRSVGDKLENQELYEIPVLCTNGLDSSDSNYKEHKLTILSPVQLEKVGDVADRIICKDGVLGVEKNIARGAIFYETISSIVDNFENFTGVILTLPNMKYQNRSNVITLEGFKTFAKTDLTTIPMYSIYCNTSNLVVCFPKGTSPEDIRAHLIGRKYIYITTQPTFIPLPHDQQIKLRTFANKTNISFGCEIEPILKASVPKSLGATVNTHTEQIDNLGKELDKVKKLEESVASEVITESDFTNVENTSNGYFEDVKLEGRTLVNLYPKLDAKNYASLGGTISNDTITINADGSWKNFMIKKDVIPLKTSTYYTFVIYIIDNTITDDNAIIHFGETLPKTDPTKFADSYHFLLKNKKGIYAFKLKTKDSFDNAGLDTRDHLTDKATSGTIVFKYMILEGDHTQNPPSYFEGLMSVGEDVNEISVLSCNENLFDNRLVEKGMYIRSDGVLVQGTETEGDRNATDYIRVNPSKEVYINGIDNSAINADKHVYFVEYDINKKVLKSNTLNVLSGKVKLNLLSDTKYIRFTVKDLDLNRCVVSYSDIHNYVTAKQDKKPILYYNPTTDSWEKPILKEWDSIEKHSDGKYYYHKRSGEVVLNGSEDWACQAPMANTIYSICTVNGVKEYSEIRCDKFNGYNYTIYADDIEGIYTAENRVKLKISNSKLSTQDVQGIETWLQANNVTVVYQLKTEEVYECTSIDLLTYENETNFIVNVGAIAPVSTLKVMCNINNVVRELQQKVSNLENYIQHVMIDALNNALNE